jgi:hypothetical protein
MQKFKYIIILVLILVLALVYLQLDDYDNISHSLLEDNIESQKTIENLQQKITTLEEKNSKLHEDIVFLHYKINSLNLEIESLELKNMQQQFQDNEIEKIEEELFLDRKDHIIKEEMQQEEFTMDNENSITGFGQTDE